MIDLTAFYLALLLAILVRAEFLVRIVMGQPEANTWIYWHHLDFWWLAVAFIAAIQYEGLYAKRVPYWEEARLLLKAALLAFLIILAVISLGKMSSTVSRLLLTITWLFSMVTFPAIRFYGKKLLHRIGLWNERVLILGAGDAGLETLRGLERENNLGYQVVGFLDDDPEKAGQLIRTDYGDYKVFGPIRHFRKFVSMVNVSTIIVAIPTAASSRIAQIASEVQRSVRNVLIVPDLKGVALLNTELRSLFMEQLFLLNIRNNLKSLSARVVKRTFDLIVSGIALAVLSPIYLATTIAVRMTSAGGAFFMQYRPGKNGKVIRIYKFRTMYTDGDRRLAEHLEKDPAAAAEWKEFRKLKRHDPRLTPIGGFLRKWSLDELPQIYSVFKGEMSMVGPRPYMVSEIKDFEDVSEIIFMAKPGICGLWQSSGRNNLSFDQRVKLESWYVLNWSLWLDIILMAKTCVAVCRAEGAY
ncbi:MAG: undecaprenyl-phosphate galactose phosphotransferase WbaP [Phycisphaerae bacterium]|nr:undecaprenyl-phosphate galactose phosphotransferase WbaP [Phycisphaerae bacterium]